MEETLLQKIVRKHNGRVNQVGTVGQTGQWDVRFAGQYTIDDATVAVVARKYHPTNRHCPGQLGQREKQRILVNFHSSRF